MANKVLHIFKGGKSNSHENRLVLHQRPADGHLKPACWEERARLNRYSFSCGSLPELAVGDVIALHTTLTFGIIEGIGVRTITPEKGLKLKLVIDTEGTFNPFDSMLNMRVFEYDGSQEKYTDTSVTKIEDVGDSDRYYLAFSNTSPLLLSNPTVIGFEVMALPSDGLKWTFDIETRLHQRQLVRPPAAMPDCC